jgi:hypothetical protein
MQIPVSASKKRRSVGTSSHQHDLADDPVRSQSCRRIEHGLQQGRGRNLTLHQQAGPSPANQRHRGPGHLRGVYQRKAAQRDAAVARDPANLRLNAHDLGRDPATIAGDS